MSGLPHALGFAAHPPAARDPGDGFVGGWAGFALESVYARLAVVARERALRAPRVRVAVPVLSVGNLAVGGTGKTPCTAWLARRLAARGHRVRIVAGRVGHPVPGAATDEAALLARLVPAAPVLVARRKAEGVQEAARAGATVIVVDDGFSHHALARDLDLVLLDASRPLGNGHLLPYGPLREAPTALARAGAIVLTRADRIDAERLARTRAAVAVLAPGVPLAAACLVPDGFRAGGEGAPVAVPAGQKAVCVSGIGRPGDLATSVRALGVEVIDDRAYPDHHRFAPAEWAAARRAAERAGAWLVVSAKDAARLEPDARAATHVVDVNFTWLGDASDVERAIDRVSALAIDRASDLTIDHAADGRTG